MPVDPHAPIEITAYEWVPDMARGHVKDIRARWALEEIGLPYKVRLVGGAGGEKPQELLTDQPFGQVPVYKEDGLTLFESGAILLHIGEKDERLLPRDPAARAAAIGWVFAALNSIEPVLQALAVLGWMASDKPWQEPAKDVFRPWCAERLAQLSGVLGTREWLADRFTIGDVAMVHVLRAAPDSAMIAAHPNLMRYMERGTERPAFKAALAAQLADFDRAAKPA
jgi:glutathione S-transferase